MYDTCWGSKIFRKFFQNHMDAKIFLRGIEILKISTSPPPWWARFFWIFFCFPLLDDLFQQSRWGNLLGKLLLHIGKTTSKLIKIWRKVIFSFFHDTCENMLSNGGRGVKIKSETGNRNYSQDNGFPMSIQRSLWLFRNYLPFLFQNSM